MARRVLMIAFHYPPCGTSSGLQRTLAFSRYLPRYGWEPALVTVSPFAYEATSDAQLSEIPNDMPIARPFAVDSARHLAIAGRYPSFLAVPDRWRSWHHTGVRSALRLARRFKPHAVWSTFPITTAHTIASTLTQRTRLPWIADMRDPMVEYDAVSRQHFPTNDAVREARLRIEADVVRHAHVVFCTRRAMEICLERYGARYADRFSVLPNGYDEATFALAQRQDRPAAPADGFRLLHSGTVYPGTDRGPEALFAALHALHCKEELPHGFRLIMRAPGHEAYLREAIARMKVEHLVELAPPLPYHSALAEMLSSDALLVLQGRTSNPAIPAKVYEYLRARKAILALVHPAGDTADLLRTLPVASLAPLDDAAGIATALRHVVSLASTGVPMLSDEVLRQYSREQQAGRLAELLESTTARETARAAARERAEH